MTLLRDGKEPMACYDCGKWCGEYMARESVWKKAFPDYSKVKARLVAEHPGMDDKSRAMRHITMCLSCLYVRLGREFSIEDFSPPEKVKMNDVLYAAYQAGLAKGQSLK